MSEPIAIVGIACRFADAPDPTVFWRNMISGHTALRPLDGEVSAPIERSCVFSPSPYPLIGARLGSLYNFDTTEQMDVPRPEIGENPDLRFAAQIAREALADAGIRPLATESIHGSVRIAYAPIFTPSGVTWLEHVFFADQAIELMRRFFPHAPEESLGEVRKALVASIPQPDAESFADAAGYRLAERVANLCAFDGVASVCDAGMLSSFDAFSIACDDLRSGRSDVALSGAIQPPLQRAELEGMSGYITFSDAREFSPFDSAARGTVPGEGGAFFVLKRRSDALRSHDRIYALVRGEAVSTVRPALAMAAERSGMSVTSISFLEADGSGMPAADRAEMESVQGLWGEHHPGGPLVGIGSVKGNIGNCFNAAGAAGLLKAALALHARVLPPQVPVLHPLEVPCDSESSVYLLTRPRPWITGDPKAPRRAAVLARGSVGRNGAVILEEEPEGRT